MYFLLAALLGFGYGTAYAQVYKTVDEHGNVIFSDTPTDGSIEIELQEPASIPPPTHRPFKYTPPRKTAPRYKQIEIVSPRDDEAIRSNSGDVSVSIVIEPALASAHKVALYLDGKEYGVGGTAFSLSNLDRGTHSLRAVVKGANDQLLLSSATIRFHLLRHSTLFRRPEQQVAR